MVDSYTFINIKAVPGQKGPDSMAHQAPTVIENAAPLRRWFYNIATLAVFVPLIINTFHIIDGIWYEHAGSILCGLVITSIGFRLIKTDSKVHLQKKLHINTRFHIIGAIFILVYIFGSLFFDLGPRLVWFDGITETLIRIALFLVYGMAYFAGIIILDSGSKESGHAPTFFVSQGKNT